MHVTTFLWLEDDKIKGESHFEGINPEQTIYVTTVRLGNLVFKGRGYEAFRRVKKRDVTVTHTQALRCVYETRRIRGDVKIVRGKEGGDNTCILEFVLVRDVHYTQEGTDCYASKVGGLFHPYVHGASHTLRFVEPYPWLWDNTGFVYSSTGGSHVFTTPEREGEDLVILQREGSFSGGGNLPEKEKALLLSLVKIYQTEIFTHAYRVVSQKDWWIVAGYALIRAMDALNNPVWKQEWLYTWTCDHAVHPFAPSILTDPLQNQYPPFGPDAKRAAVLVHALRHESMFRHQIETSGLVCGISLLSRIRRLQCHGWGQWFVRGHMPQASYYTCTMTHRAKTHEIHVKFNFTGYNGGRLVIHVTEWSGAVVEKVLEITPDAKHEWIITLSQTNGPGKGGRNKRNEADRKLRWESSYSNQTHMTIMKEYPVRKFWATKEVRHVYVDAMCSSMLIPKSIAAPLDWWLEILDEIRFSNDKSKVPFHMQICAVRECLHPGPLFTKARAFLILLLADRKLSEVLRVEIARCLLAKGNDVVLRSTWMDLLFALSDEENTVPDGFIVDMFIEHGLMVIPEKDTFAVEELLLDLVLVCEQNPTHTHLRPKLCKAIFFPYEEGEDVVGQLCLWAKLQLELEESLKETKCQGQ